MKKRRSQPRRDDRHTGNSPADRWNHRPKFPPPDVDPTPHRARAQHIPRNYGVAAKWRWWKEPSVTWYATERARDQAFDKFERELATWRREHPGETPSRTYSKVERRVVAAPRAVEVTDGR